MYVVTIPWIQPFRVMKTYTPDMLITVSNLFPRPDHPTLGMYNYYLFREMTEEKGIQKVFEERPRHYLNICLVPSWKVWQWRTIRQWTSPNQVPTTYLPVFTLPWVGRSINWWFYARSLRRYLTSPSGHDSTTQQLNNLTTEGSPDTFYVPWLYPDGVAVARAIRGTGARLWLMALGSDTFHLRSPLRRKMILESCRAAEGIICVANVLADRLADAGVPREKLHVVPNGVDTALFTPQTLDHRPETIASPTILYVGNLVPVKGPDLLLEAVAMLKKTSGLNAEDVSHGSNVYGLRSKVSPGRPDNA